MSFFHSNTQYWYIELPHTPPSPLPMHESHTRNGNASKSDSANTAPKSPSSSSCLLRVDGIRLGLVAGVWRPLLTKGVLGGVCTLSKGCGCCCGEIGRVVDVEGTLPRAGLDWECESMVTMVNSGTISSAACCERYSCA